MANDYVLSPQELDALGEISNISMGSSATALSALVQNKKVTIKTPTISVINRSHALDDYSAECIIVHINYVVGLDGGNILLLKPHDVLVIADLMMGGTGENIEDRVVGDLELSAIQEAMNQMMGSSATSLSVMLSRPVDISPPETGNIDVESVKVFEKLFESPEKDMVKVAFRLKIGNLIDSTMVQLYKLDFCQGLIGMFIKQLKISREKEKNSEKK
jgi:flagellar motor switch protein FliN/FliY